MSCCADAFFRGYDQMMWLNVHFFLHTCSMLPLFQLLVGYEHGRHLTTPPFVLFHQRSSAWAWATCFHSNAFFIICLWRYFIRLKVENHCTGVKLLARWPCLISKTFRFGFCFCRFHSAAVSNLEHPSEHLDDLDKKRVEPCPPPFSCREPTNFYFLWFLWFCPKPEHSARANDGY